MTAKSDYNASPCPICGAPLGTVTVLQIPDGERFPCVGCFRPLRTMLYPITRIVTCFEDGTKTEKAVHLDPVAKMVEWTSEEIKSRKKT